MKWPGAVLALLLAAALPAAAQVGDEPWQFRTQKDWDDARKEFDPRELTKVEKGLYSDKKEAAIEALRMLRELKQHFETAIKEIERGANLDHARQALKWAIARQPEPGFIQTDKGDFAYHPYVYLARTYVARSEYEKAERCLAREADLGTGRAKQLYDSLSAEVRERRDTAAQRDAAVAFARWAGGADSGFDGPARQAAAAALERLEALPATPLRAAIEENVEPLRRLAGQRLQAARAALEPFARPPWPGYLDADPAAALGACAREPSLAIPNWRAQVQACDEALHGSRSALVGKLCALGLSSKLPPPAWCAGPAWPDWNALAQFEGVLAKRMAELNQPRPVKPRPTATQAVTEPPPVAPPTQAEVAPWPATALPPLKEAFGQLAAGALDGAIVRLRAAVAEGAFGRANGAAALARGSLSYFLYLKQRATDEGDAALLRLLEQDAQAQARAALAEDRSFAPSPGLFPEEFREWFRVVTTSR
ncbi:MAG: hypothetical protein KBD01_11855 [Acidobacteria bacterium]|nr:hypothetical protein [Acidobacteriota bacterium]